MCKVTHRIIIDCEEFTRNVRNANRDFLGGKKVIKAENLDQLSFSEEDLLICSPRVAGFSLAWKRWGTFGVDDVKDLVYNVDAFDNLVFAEDKKILINSLVAQQGADNDDFDDLIVGKGKGLIFLLHGPPGSWQNIHSW